MIGGVPAREFVIVLLAVFASMAGLWMVADATGHGDWFVIAAILYLIGLPVFLIGRKVWRWMWR